MSPQAFLQNARRIDADIQALDRRRFIATYNHAPQLTILKMDAQRNALVRAWAKAWHTKPVIP